METGSMNKSLKVCPSNKDHIVQIRHMITDSFHYCTNCKEDIEYIEKSLVKKVSSRESNTFSNSSFRELDYLDKLALIQCNYHFSSTDEFVAWPKEDQSLWIDLRDLMEEYS